VQGPGVILDPANLATVRLRQGVFMVLFLLGVIFINLPKAFYDNSVFNFTETFFMYVSS
jgi:hypothetical protein